MKKQKVLVFSILCLSLTLAIFSFGVFAAQQCNVLVENTIIFDTSNSAPLFSIEGSVSGCTQDVPKYNNSMPLTALGTAPDPLWTWEIGELTFRDIDVEIVYTFKVVNLEPSDQIMASIVYASNANSRLDKNIFPANGRTINSGSSSSISFSVKIKAGTTYDNVFSEDNNFRVIIERVAI